MRELIRLVEQPRICSYLPSEIASLEVRGILDMSPAEYADLLSRGYRRFGWQVFRPACPQCVKCRSVRVVVDQFEPGASERRILRKNEGIRAEIHPLFVTPEHVDLYNRYHHFMNAHRAWPLQQTDAKSYASEFCSGAVKFGRQWLYFDADRLVGVAIMDEAPRAISLVYFFYDPEWRANSPGTYSILNQLLYAKERTLKYAYLGYWIEACQSMSYKGRFHPREELLDYPPERERPVWALVSERATIEPRPLADVEDP
jgi:arginine-tRNA-protein transferase